MRLLPPKGASRQKKTQWAWAVFFLIQIPVALVTGLKDSVPYLVFLSLWALVASHWSGYLAAPD